MKIAIALVALSLSYRSDAPTYSFQHGTVVTTLAVRDGFVMAADGLTVRSGGADAQPFQGVRAPAEPKIAICGEVFLCGMAGLNPLPLGKAGLEYHFQQWVSAIAPDHASSPEKFSKIIEREAQRTFRDMETVLKDPFFKSKAAPSTLLKFQIAGYAGDSPQVCQVEIEIEPESSTLLYPGPACHTPEWKSSSPTSYRPYDLSFSTEAARTAGTPEFTFVQEILPTAHADVRSLRPGIPEALQKTIAVAAAFIWAADKFQPAISGGKTTIGVLQEGQTPEVFQFPDL